MTQPTNPEPSATRYQRALKFLDERVDFERFQAMPGPEREIKLDRMRDLLARLGNPQDKLHIVHVAGTKGKGSTSAMIAAMLKAAGYRTGLFTSPHLDRVEERIAIDGQPCTADEFATLVAAVRPVVEELDREAAARASGEYGPTYFEILTAMALLHFVRQGVQAVVLEVGLGGRLDSTNVCRPLVSVITSISYDHLMQLGDTLKSIAREKAGIIKPGVPVVSGVKAQESRDTIRQIAKNCNCRLVELNEDFRYEYHPPQNLEKQPVMGSLDFWLSSSRKSPLPPGESQDDKSPLPLGEGQGEGCVNTVAAAADLSNIEQFGSEGSIQYQDLPISLLGRHQAANAAVALATINELNRQGWKVSEQSIRQGLAAVYLPARIEIIARQPVVILDSAHNAASIAALMEVLKESFSVSRRLLLFATTREKDYQEMLKLLLEKVEKGDKSNLFSEPSGPFRQIGPVPFFDEIIFTQYTTNPRAKPPAELEAVAFQLTGRHYPTYPNPAEAWNNLRQLAAPDDLICITGSFFLAGEMRKML